MVTIPISPITLGKLAVELGARESVAALLDRPVEAWGIEPGRLVCCDTRNAFAVAAHDRSTTRTRRAGTACHRETLRTRRNASHRSGTTVAASVASINPDDA